MIERIPLEGWNDDFVPLDYLTLRAMEMYHKAYAQVTEHDRELVHKCIVLYHRGFREPDFMRIFLDPTIKTYN